MIIPTCTAPWGTKRAIRARIWSWRGTSGFIRLRGPSATLCGPPGEGRAGDDQGDAGDDQGDAGEAGEAGDAGDAGDAGGGRRASRYACGGRSGNSPPPS